jgi:pullulanase
MKKRTGAVLRLSRLGWTLYVLSLCAGFVLPALAATDPPIPAGSVRIHYFRPDNTFTGWTMWTWNASTENQTTWCSTELNQAGTDSYGAYWDVTVNPTWGTPAGDLGFIIHNCVQNVKDPGPDMHLNTLLYNEAWVISGDPTVYTTQPTPQQILNGVFQEEQAYWLDRRRLAIQPQYFQSGWTYFLNASPSGGLQLGDSGVTGGSSLQLVTGGSLTADELARYPQLASYAVLQLPANTPLSTIRKYLIGQVVVSAVDSTPTLKYATGIQIGGILDDLYYYPGKLGVIFNPEDSDAAPIQLKVWAPTAQGVSLLLFNRAADTTPAAIIPMQQSSGVWAANGKRGWEGKYYLYQVSVYVPGDHTVHTNLTTDPYSIDISVNGTKSRITNLDADSTKPAGWDESNAPPLRSVSDMSIYEVHIRDFSIGDSSVPPQDQGMYEAFRDFNSNGMKHLRALAGSGLKAVHIMPSFHFASVNEDKSTWQTTGDLSTYPPDGMQQQAAVAAIQSQDGYNWGYDPVHYMTPEGSYAINPDQRVREYRTMVEGLHAAGLRVIQDVVFNHTNASGEGPNSNLDEVVPGYYHRYDANGHLETGSCCADTASEHRMMEKLMIDTLVLNAREYKIDGFRFDIMNFHFTYNMQNIQRALAALTPRNSGVDGSKIYLYGEGWNFGDTGNDQIGPSARQANLYGYGIGTFNDRVRDGIRGGGPFSDERVQGFATGLYTDPSSYTNSTTSTLDQQNQLLQESDWIRVGLTGNLRDYTFLASSGSTGTGAQVDYNGQPAGYTKTPIEVINYASVHDNQDLFDAVQLKSSESDSIATRARRQVLAMSLVQLGQGIPFFYAGDDMLRSKDMDQNSYDSGDWFNKIDWSGQTANWGIGLPIASQNSLEQWSFQQPLLANAALAPQPANIAATKAAFQDFMRIRYSSGLFRMSGLADIQQNLTFLNTGQNQTPGLIVMKLDENAGRYDGFNHVLVVFNATNSAITFTDSHLQGLHFHLHPVLLNSIDPVVKQSTFNSQPGSFSVPALTTAVFVQ